MIKNSLLITLRSMMKNKFFIVINILGMAVAVALCIVGYFAYDYDASFDAVHQNAQHIYRVSSVREFQNKSRLQGITPFPLGGVVGTFEDVDRSSRYFGSWASYLLADSLMANLWRYYKGVTSLTFVLAILLLFAVSFLAIGYKVFTATSMNPVDSLKED